MHPLLVVLFNYVVSIGVPLYVLGWKIYLPLFVLYLIVTFWRRPEINGHYRSEWVRGHFIQRMWHKYMGIHVIYKQGDSGSGLSEDKQYVFGIHPHGMMGFSHSLPFGAHGNIDECPGKRWRSLRSLAAPFLFWVPIAREYVMALGGISNCKSAYNMALEQGHSVSLNPGGYEEIPFTNAKLEVLDGDDVWEHLTIVKRTGWIAIAARHHVPIVPVFAKGESQCYNVYTFESVPLIKFIDECVDRWFGFPPFFIFFGNMLTWFPNRSRIFVYIGEPIETKPPLECGSQVNVDAIVSKFYTSIRQMAEDAKCKIHLKESR